MDKTGSFRNVDNVVRPIELDSLMGKPAPPMNTFPGSLGIFKGIQT